MQCCDYSCQNRDAFFGYCKLIACTKHSYAKIYAGNNIDLNVIIFPQTIGDITFYSGKELIKWVENQQRMNQRQGIWDW